MIEHFCQWLGATSLSQEFQDAAWFVPTVQTLHILAIAVVVTLLGAIHLRVLGISRRGRPVSELAGSFLPWAWRALAVLLLTGILLTITEPARELLNVLFWVKMLLVLALVALTLWLRASLTRHPQRWTAAPPRLGKAIASLSLLLLVGIVAAGRWIAYV